MRQGAAPEFAGADCGVAAGAGSAAGKRGKPAEAG
jgi:hypothetical protein